ncbi:hypothetical protein DKG82_22675 [Salmonella enterica subsp. enterica serovar Lexington]|nr:hypothetical protein [Salmonella enterica subsp. enterica serovar Lexington]EAZ0618760.1 helix-turn-helix domain-containing protein [Salmonella enterica]EBP3214345.1 helix-turn-helix domain-containing protein [Salmonella enterica subsp. arizonae]ECF5887247.1 helix-turn-helix domain-containing protein [Salmonella enterica subsp. indica]ECM3796595.1 helix-turn-helix domain-containing protein [Salmonella enterica subsp. enterica serovar Newport]EDR2773587.1 helix-turn-helix domain-containing p
MHIRRKYKRVKNKRSGILRHTVQTLLRWVEKKLHYTVRVAELSAVAGYCIRHLGNGFIQVTGISLARYIRLRKLTQAANLLRLTRRPVTDIALTYAFGSLQAFSRAFRQHFGMSPKAYREAEVCPQGQLIPPPVRNNYQYTAYQCNHAGFWLQPYAQQKIKIPLSLHMTLSEQGILREDLYTLFYNHLFRHNPLETFTIIADVIKKHGHDMWVQTTSGTHARSETQGAVFIPAAHWFCFEFCGALKDIMNFHFWAKVHGLKKHGVIPTGGTTFTTYRRLSPNADRYSIRYGLPVFPQDITATPDETGMHCQPCSVQYG